MSKPKVTSTDLNKTQPVQRSRPKRHSNFLITINTNQVYDPNNPDSLSLETRFDQALSTIFADTNIPNLIDFKIDGHTFTRPYIDSINVERVIEYNGKTNQNRLHAHVFVQVAHRSKIHLKLSEIKQKIMEDTGLSNLYFYTKVYRHANDNLENVMRNYLKKEVDLVES